MIDLCRTIGAIHGTDVLTPIDQLSFVNGRAGTGPPMRPGTHHMRMSRAWNDLLLGQDGVVSRAQALEHGIPGRTIARRVAEGAWRRIHPGVYLVGGHALTYRARIRAAWLWAGPGSVITGPAAALWLGMLDGAPGPVDVTVGRTLRRRSPPGVRLRHRDLDPLDHAMVRGVGVTEPALTVLETAAVLRDGATFLDRALQQKLVRFESLHDAYCRSVGAYGIARARELLVACADRADSAAERRLIGLLRRAGISGFVVGHPFGRTQIDIAFPDARLALEFDSWAWHTDPERFTADREKGNALVDAGWAVLRITWKELTEHPDRIVDRIRSALLRAA